MRRLFTIGALLGVLFAPTVAYADDATIVIDAPKGVIGYDGIRCIGEASQGGHHLKLTTYVGYSAGQPEESERRWQLENCKWVLEQDMGGWFWFRHGIKLDPSNIKMSVERV